MWTTIVSDKIDNIMRPEPHRILKIVRQTKAEYTFRVEYSGESKNGQFFMLSIPRVGEAPISISGKGDGYIERSEEHTSELQSRI